MQQSSLPYHQPYFEQVLLFSIAVLILTGLGFFIVTLVKRTKRIKESRQKEIFQQQIDAALFSFLFDDKKIEEITEGVSFSKNFESGLFKRLCVKSIISLHYSYSGAYSKRLEDFYAQSGLADYSLKKLNSEKWTDIVEGIRDLSNLNYVKAYPRIVSYKNHEHELVRTEVLLGMIKLKGITELAKFNKSKLYLNDWVQSNILYTVKRHHIPAPENMADLLNTKNQSLLLMAVRLINHYNKPEHYSLLSEYISKTKNEQIRVELKRALRKTEQIS